MFSWRWLAIRAKALLIPLALATILVAVAVSSFSVANAYTVAEPQGKTGIFKGPSFQRAQAPQVYREGALSKISFPGLFKASYARGLIEVSDEFKDHVVSVAGSDADVESFLGEGYNVTAVVPTVKAVVQGDGTVVLKATGAVLVLKKGTSCVIVYVDLQQNQVTQINTMIKKGSTAAGSSG